VIETDDGARIAVEIRDGQGTVLGTAIGKKREITVKAGECNIDVTVQDSGGEQRFLTDHFILTRNGKQTVDARREAAKFEPATAPASLATDPPTIPASADPDRRAAEWVLSIGGGISIKENGKERQMRGFLKYLPQRAFELTVVRCDGNEKVSDAALAHFKDCKNLTQLSLSGTQVSDAGLANFKDCKNLNHLNLSGSQVSDAGLANFKDCKNLNYLDLSGTQVSDAGLAHFKDCKNLTHLDLSGTQVKGAGLANFKDCKNLTGLALNGTQVSDAGIKHLAGLTNLEVLDLRRTKATAAGVAELKKALPSCVIVWDEGESEGGKK